MASIYTRDRSPFYWVEYIEPATGRRVQRSTGIRVNTPDGKLLANRRRAEFEVKELSAPKARKGERWEAWARDYLQERYEGTGSLKNALVALVDILAFCDEFAAPTPAALTYSIAR